MSSISTTQVVQDYYLDVEPNNPPANKSNQYFTPHILAVYQRNCIEYNRKTNLNSFSYDRPKSPLNLPKNNISSILLLLKVQRRIWKIPWTPWDHHKNTWNNNQTSILSTHQKPTTHKESQLGTKNVNSLPP